MTGRSGAAPRPEVEIVSLSVEGLRADTSGRTVGEMADLAYRAFREPPWCDDCERTRLHFGIGVDLMRDGAAALVARRTDSGGTVGYVLGYAVARAGDGVRRLGLADIGGSEELVRWLPAAAPVFYIDTLCVEREFRRARVGVRLCRILADQLRDEGFGWQITRTHVAAHAARTLFGMLGFRELPVADRTFPDRTYWLLALS